MVCSLPSPLLLSDSFLLCPGQYDAHLARQAADIKAFAEDESLLLDPKLEYSTVAGLSGEVIERLYRIRPTTIVCFLLSQAHIWQLTTLFQGAAKRMEGMTPTSLISLLKHAKRTWGTTLANQVHAS